MIVKQLNVPKNWQTLPGTPYAGEPKNLGPFTRKVAVPKPKKPAVPKPPTSAPPADPYAGLESQASQQIHAIYDPIIQQLKDAAQSAITTGSNAITGYTSALADRLGSYAPASRQANTAAQQSLAALEAAAGQQLRGEGSSLADQLGKQLGQINAPNAGAVTSNLTNTANNAAAADYTSGNAQLQNLVEQGQHAADYIGKLPGIAGLTGLQNIRDLTASTNRNLTDQLGQVSAQIPSAVQSLLSQMQSARQQQQQFNASQTATAKANAAQLAEQRREFNITAKADGIKIANQQALDYTNARQKANAAQQAQANRDRSYRLEWTRVWGYDPVTGNVAPGWHRNPAGNVVKNTNGGSGGGSDTKAATQGEVQSFLNGLTSPTYTTVRKSDGAGGSVSTRQKTGISYQMGFRQAYRRLRAMGVDDKTARSELDTIYPRGQHGRAWLTNEEQQALRAAQSKIAGPAATNVVKVREFKSHGYLTAQQAAILRQAGLLPPGEAGLVNGVAIWYIHPGV